MKKLYFGTCLFALFLSHEVSAADVYVRQIAVKGLERVEPETVASYLDIKKGQNVSQEKLDSSLKQLYASVFFFLYSICEFDGLLCFVSSFVMLFFSVSR